VEFDWDADNLRHIARHGIDPREAEDAVLIEPLEADLQPHGSEERVLCFWAHQIGRLLTVLYTERRGKIRVVTAYEMTKHSNRCTSKENRHAQQANRNSEVRHRSR